MKDELIKRMARLEAQSAKIGETRKALTDRAKEQWDTMPKAIERTEADAATGRGGVLTQRYLRTLLTERARLGQVIQDGDARSDDD